MRKIYGLITFLMLCIFTVTATAQSYELRGIVKDDLGELLPGANIIIKGTTNGTLTNMEGAFIFEVNHGDILIVSFIGMDKQEIAITGQNDIFVVLGADSELMQEVMVVAYGTSTKEAFTGAATVIDNASMEKQPVSNLAQALQGKAANVMVSNSSGQPGTTGSVRIRGVGSMSASSAPLYVVDGVATANSISNINPADIESITVLKDASATSLYGSRAANGVIIVTTKRGNSGEGKIRFSSKTGITSISGSGYDIMNAEQYYTHTWEGLYNEGIEQRGLDHSGAIEHANSNMVSTTGFNPYSTDNPFTDQGQINPSASLEYDTDWRDAVYQTGIMQDYSLVATGGDEKGSYFISGAYYNETGVVIGSDYERFNLTANFDKEVKHWLSLSSKNSFTYSDSNGQPSGGEASNPVRAAQLINPVSPVYNDDGSYNWDNLTSYDFNPVGLAESDVYNSTSMNFSTSLMSEILLPFDIKYTATGAVDYYSGNSTMYYNPEHGNGVAVNGRLSVGTGNNLAMSITNLFSWNKDFGGHSLGAMAGHEGRYERYEYLSAESINGLVPGNTSLSNFSTPVSNSSGVDAWSMLSYFGQANYDYFDKYYVSASLRSDGSSRFGTNKRWGAFYSIGGAWRISQEDFFDVDFVDNLKMRMSYGTSGNNSIGNNTWQALYGLGANYGGNSGIVPVQLENPDLTWESINKSNIALEATMFSKLNVILELYNNVSDELLLAQPYAPSRGYTSSMSNIGAMSNRGIELSADYLAISTDKFSWNTGFNISSNKNEIQNLSQDQIISGTKRWYVGGDMYNFYMREWAGVDPSNGKPMWYTNADAPDIDGSTQPSTAYTDPLNSGRQVTNEYSDAERIDMGSALPKVFGSINNGFSYGDFTLDFSFYFSVGGKIYNDDYAQNMHDGTNGANNLAVDAQDAWTPTNTHTDVPIYINNNLDGGNNMSSRYLEDASYLRLKNLSLAYNLPSSVLDRSCFSQVQFYVSSNNLFTWTKYKGYDPEAGISGVTSFEIPGTKSTVFGLNITF